MASAAAAVQANDSASPAPGSPKPARKPRGRANGPRRFPESPSECSTGNNTSRNDNGNRSSDNEAPARRLNKNESRNEESHHSRPSKTRKNKSPQQQDLQELREVVGTAYERKGLKLLNSYIKNNSDLAKFQTGSEFLLTCEMLWVLPLKYRLTNSELQKTQYFRRTLERLSFQVMRAEFRYQRKRSSQIVQLLEERTNQMKQLFDQPTLEKVTKLVKEHFDRKVRQNAEQHARILDSLIEEYDLSDLEIREAEKRRAVFERRERVRLERREAAKSERRPRITVVRPAAAEVIENEVPTQSNQINESNKPVAGDQAGI